MPTIKGHDPKTEAEIMVHAKDDEPLAALAFKLQNDPFVGQLIYFRVYAGVLNAGSYIYNTSTGNKERVGRILRMHANSREEIKRSAGWRHSRACGLEGHPNGAHSLRPRQADIA